MKKRFACTLLLGVTAFVSLIAGVFFAPTHVFAQVDPNAGTAPPITQKRPAVKTVASTSSDVVEQQPALEVPAQPMNITISPVSLNLLAKPGEVRQNEIRVLNNGSQPEEITLELKTFKAYGNKGQAQLLDVTGNEEYLRWLTFDRPSYIVQPGEWKSINVRFAPPANAGLSYYYSILFKRKTMGVRPAGDDQARLEAIPAMLVLTTVDTPNAKRELQLAKFEATPKVTEFLPETFNVTVKNTGNVYAAPTGNIFIHGQGKKDLTVLSFNPEGGQVLPNSEREFTVKWRDGFPTFPDAEENADPSQPRVESMQFLGVEWNFGKAHMFRFGRYTANLIMVYDDGQRDVPVEANVVFWVIPWRILLVTGLIGLLVVVGIAAVAKSVYGMVPKSTKRSSSMRRR